MIRVASYVVADWAVEAGEETIEIIKQAGGEAVFVRTENGVLAIVLVAIVAVMGVLSGGLSVTRRNIVNVILQSSTRGTAGIYRGLFT